MDPRLSPSSDPAPDARPRRLAAALACSAIAAAALAPNLTAAERKPPSTVPEAYVSAENGEDELDSLATWTAADGGTWLIATAKSAHRLVVFDADSGRRLRTVGEAGAELGRLQRPNGVAVAGDRLFVVERDNRRVQVFALPDFRPLGSFGDAQLRSPYGLWLLPSPARAGDATGGADALDVYVTDSFMDGARYDVVPPLERLNERVRRYRLRFDRDGGFVAQSLGSFGDTREASALRVVESIAGDARAQRLLIADEDRRRGESTLREYGFDGRYRGRAVPAASFEAEAEGVTLWECGARSGYWVAVDQLPARTIFRVFERGSLARRGGFQGEVVAQTDGIALRTAPTRRFPNGALFAVHRDKAVAAFDLRDVAAALTLPARCLQRP